MAAWSGLGYYHRARNLHRGARHVRDQHAGRFPRTLEAALAVPGVGLYTASAVLSIAYGVPLPVVDGNVRRVLARLFALRGPKWRKDGPFYNRAQELLAEDAPGRLEPGGDGAGRHRLHAPEARLRRLPAAGANAGALALGIVDRLPEGKARRATVAVTVAAALVERHGRILLVRRAEGRLMGGMWEVPADLARVARASPDLVPELRERHQLEVRPGRLRASARHAITFRRIRVEAYEARLARQPPDDPERYAWALPDELSGFAISSLTRKVVRALAAPQLPLALE